MTDATRRPIRRALVSVYDKTELAAVGRALVEAGAEIVSTGSTARTLAEAGLPVTQIEQVTGFGECLDGRVKTLHPAVHAGLLADLRLESHRTQLGELGIASFDLLVSNLYPFSATVASGATPEECVEQIDIGGPAMVRSSAKNHASVAVVTSPGQYPQLFDALAAGGFTLDQRQQLAAEAFAHTAAYDIAVAGWLRQEVTESAEPFSSWAGASWRLAEVLRYGENPHQQAALYRDDVPGGPGVPPRGLAQQWRPGSRPRASSTGNRCRTTTTSMPMPPGGARTTSPRRRWRSSSTPTRAASRSARTSRRHTGRRMRVTRSRRSAE